MAFVAQFGADISRAAVLPDDGVVEGLAGFTVPHQGGFALIGDADGGDIAGCDPGFFNRGAGGSCRGGPQICGVMFDPAGRREMLGKFFLRLGYDAQVFIKNDRAGRGGALVDG